MSNLEFDTDAPLNSTMPFPVDCLLVQSSKNGIIVKLANHRHDGRPVTSNSVQWHFNKFRRRPGDKRRTVRIKYDVTIGSSFIRDYVDLSRVSCSASIFLSVHTTTRARESGRRSRCCGGDSRCRARWLRRECRVHGRSMRPCFQGAGPGWRDKRRPCRMFR